MCVYIYIPRPKQPNRRAAHAAVPSMETIRWDSLSLVASDDTNHNRSICLWGVAPFLSLCGYWHSKLSFRMHSTNHPISQVMCVESQEIRPVEGDKPGLPLVML